jgi:hypothetical protein
MAWPVWLSLFFARVLMPREERRNQRQNLFHDGKDREFIFVVWRSTGKRYEFTGDLASPEE